MNIQKSGDPSKTLLPLFVERGGGKGFWTATRILGNPPSSPSSFHIEVFNIIPKRRTV